MILDTFVVVAMIAVIGGCCYYAGWRSAASYLSAARAVSDVSNAAIAQANDFSAALDKSQASLTQLADAVEKLTEATNSRQGKVEDSIMALLAGMQRAGYARAAHQVGRQVGEPTSET